MSGLRSSTLSLRPVEWFNSFLGFVLEDLLRSCPTYPSAGAEPIMSGMLALSANYPKDTVCELSERYCLRCERYERCFPIKPSNSA
eukprot:1744974-Rhodomonas_salina.2